MKRFITILTLILLSFLTKAQRSNPDSLRKELRSASTDSARYQLNRSLNVYYEEKKLDSAVFFAEQALIIARKNKKQLSIASALLGKAFPLNSNGKYGEALACIIEALAISEDPASEKNEWRFDSSTNVTERRLFLQSTAHHIYALVEANMGNYDEELFHYKEEIRIAEKINNDSRVQYAYMNLGNTYKRLGKPDSALYYGLKSDSMAKASGNLYYNGWNLGNIGDNYFEKKEYELAKKYYYEAFDLSKEKRNEGSLRAATNRLFRLYFSEKNADSSLYFAKLTLSSTISNEVSYLTGAYEILYKAYSLKGQTDSADKYLKLAFTTRDSAYEVEIKNLTDFQHLSMNEQLRLRKLEKEKVEYQGKIRMYALLGGLGVFLLIGLILYRNNRQKQKANKVLESTLTNLKATQTQLIQSEKMASLGELTAGIAHEIQNPLNFVNNFSDVNSELIVEMQDEMNKGNIVEAKAISNDIKDNEEKIKHHGKRADAIVKGMLQHSRTSSGEKEPTDINALCDEYLRLAYHGMRAKDKTFNAKIETSFDNSVGNLNIVSQDIGRVILNLINNAFYAVNERLRHPAQAGQPVSHYEPTVTVRTKKLNGNIEIGVTDNGNGIPESIKEKIFQPFFTTKQTGEGTGLGLSLSYDIIKAHGGEIKVNTKENEGTELIIQLPAKENLA